MSISVLQPLLELLKVERPEDLTNEEIVQFRAWLRDAYESVGRETEEPGETASLAPTAPQTTTTGVAHPNPDALAAVYARMSWFLARRERELRAKNF